MADAATPAAELVSDNDHLAARRIATLAGEFLLELRERGATSGVSEDVRAQELILAELARAFPDDAVIAEEASPERARQTTRRVWIVDPLDGTREFGEPGRSDWAVHVALAVDGELVAGAVALPARGITLATDSVAPPPPASGARRLVVSRSRASPRVLRLAERLELDIVPLGSAGAKAMAVVLGDAEVYAHSGGQYEWDSAAPAAVAAAAGLHVSRLDGSPLSYNQPDPWLPDLLICRPEFAQATIAASLADDSSQ
jgi:3'(2'), 5'-bisphosphate nucleotidase